MTYSYGRAGNSLYEFKEVALQWNDRQSQDKYGNWTIYHGTFGLSQITQTKLRTEL
jgi:hypothetical protein